MIETNSSSNSESASRKLFILLSENITIWQCVVFALILRVLFATLFLLTTSDTNYSPLAGETFSLAGSDGIIQVGYNWLANGSYSLTPGGREIAFRPPLPVFLSGVCALLTTHYWYIPYIAINCLLGSALIFVCWHIFKLLAIPSGIFPNLALLIIAIHPYMVFSVKTLTAINLLAFILALTALFLMRALQGHKHASLYLGIILGAGALSHGSFLLLPFACAFALLIGGQFHCIPIKCRLTSAVIVISTTFMIVAPWTVRNHYKFQMFIPTATGAGLQFWITEDVVAGSFTGGNTTYREIEERYQKKTGKTMAITHGGVVDPKQDAELAKWGKELLVIHPLHFFKRLGFGLFGFWAPLDQGLRKALIVGLVNLPLLLASGLLIAIAAYRRVYDWNSTVILGICCYIWGIFAAIQAISSYFVMITPMVVIHGAYLASLIARSRTRDSIERPMR